MSIMAAPNRKPGRPRGRQDVVISQIRLPPELDRVFLLQCVADHRSKNAEIIVALEEFLAKRGKWPPTPELPDPE